MRLEALTLLRCVEHVHGHLGWLAAAVLVHPAVLLRDGKRRAHAAVATAAGLVTLVAALGAWLYVGYREHLRQRLFIESRTVGLLFERKEHLAFGVLLLAWAGAAAYFASSRAGEATREHLRKVAYRAFCVSAALAVVVAVLGTTVAVCLSF